MFKKTIKSLALVLGAIMLLSLLASCCCNTHEHMWIDADCTRPMRCDKCDATQGQPLGHNWQAATCENPKTCYECGATEGRALGHDWADATFESPKTCKSCYATEGTKLNKFDWLKDYIVKYGEYDYSDNEYEYVLTTTSAAKVYLYYDPTDPDEIVMYHFQTSSSSSFSALISVTLTENLGGEYTWVLVDTSEYYMVGTVYGSTFSSSVNRLAYSTTNYPSSVTTDARELGALSVKYMLSSFDDKFAQYGLTGHDLGFAGY